ncbi:SETMR methyltransferase, partial [Acromyrmex heyeri]
MDSKLEQRTCIKFCCKNEIKCSDTLKMLQKCYGDDTLSKTQVYQWYERFKSGREAVEDDARPGRPSTSKTDENVDEIRQLLIENRKLTIREIAETTNISFGSVQSILREDLGLILHDDNAPSHNALIIREFLVKNNTNTIQQPPNSPDLAPCLNNQHPNIHFTIDIEKNGKLLFLDVLVSKKADGTLDHQVYRKPTHTDTYVPSRTTTQYKNSLQSIHLYIELSLSLTKNISDRTQSLKINLTEKRQKRHNQNNQ